MRNDNDYLSPREPTVSALMPDCRRLHATAHFSFTSRKPLPSPNHNTLVTMPRAVRGEFDYSYLLRP
jgi:hypothetical protein